MRATCSIAATGALAVSLLTPGCGRPRPALPETARSSGPVGSVSTTGPEVPGVSREFEEMAIPPGQLTRTVAIGDQWGAGEEPVYRSLCLRCHSVSQTSFAVQDWRESLHARAGILCGGCHGAHEAGFVARPDWQQCLMCHAQEVEEFLASAHGPERAPGMRCASCHEAHATDRGLAKSAAVCLGCHLESDHVQGYPASRMGHVLARHPPGADGKVRAPDCVSCHQPDSPLMRETGDFRNDRVTLHDPAITVSKHPKDETRLADETIELLLPLCEGCHSKRNARYRLENSDPLIRHWAPIGMAREVRKRPTESVPSTSGGQATR